MSEPVKVVNQWLRDFTIQIRDAHDQIAGTGVVISDDGKIVTCAHVIRNVLDGESHPRDHIGAAVNVYFPQARRSEDKPQTATITACFAQHADDVVLLKLNAPLSPLEPGKYARIYRADQSDGNPFRSYGYRRLDRYDAAYAWGEIGGSIGAPEDEIWQAEPLQLDSPHIDRGMSGAAVLDMELNLVVGIIAQTWYPNESGKDQSTAFGVNAHVLTLPPLLVEAYTGELPYPRQAGQTPRLTPEQEQQVKSAPTPAPADLSRAPNVLPEWVGRADLLATLHADYRAPSARVIGLVGYGGEGKTSLARKFLDELLNAPDRPSAAFWWSFYEDRSPDSFFEAALTYFGGADMARSATSASARAGYLAALMRDQRALIVLDGFEVMQHEDGDQYGALTSEALRDFLRMAATVGGDSLCVVTSRAPLIDLVAYTTFRQHDVTRLSDADGRDLLRAVGVKGDDAALNKIVERWDGHALTLSLIGSYLKVAETETVGQDEVLKLLASDAGNADQSMTEQERRDNPQRYVRRILRRYDEHLTEAERAFLLIFSAFRRPVRADAFGKVFRAATTATTLNAPVTGMSDAAFDALVRGLEQKRLIRLVTENDGTNAYTAHPLVRAHYGDLLTARDDKSYLHRQIVKYYDEARPKKVSEFPTLNDIVPYIEMVYHLCSSGTYEAAYDVYDQYIDQRERGVIAKHLGAYETILELMIMFFKNNDTTLEPAVTSFHRKRFIVNAIGFSLMNLGRLLAAVSFFERQNAIASLLSDMVNLSVGERNLSVLYAYLGELDASLDASKRALTAAAKEPNITRRLIHESRSYCYIAWSHHLRGHEKVAEDQFSKAETIQRQFELATRRYLYSVGGNQYAVNLLRSGNVDYARRVVEANIRISRQEKLVGSLGVSHRVMGDISTHVGKPEVALNHYNEAIKVARGIDKRDVWIDTLLGRGRWYAKHMHDAPAAFNDLNEALGYAVSGEYRIYEADIRVALAWAHKANGDSAQARVEAERARADSISMGYHWGQVDADEVLAGLGDGN